MKPDIERMYKEKLITPDQFPDLVRDGDVVQQGNASSAASREIYDALCARYEEFHDVLYLDETQMYLNDLDDPDNIRKIRGHINVESWFFGTNKQMRNNAKLRLQDFRHVAGCDATPIIGPNTDVLTLQCTPPNEQGFMNIGLTNFWHKDVIDHRDEVGIREIVVQVNDQMPEIWGDNWIHLSQVDHIYEKSAEPIYYHGAEPYETDIAIAENVLELMCDGACIQMGIGSIPEQVVPRLTAFKHLGINSELIPMGLPDLVAKGCVDNSRKEDGNAGISIATMVMGDKELYDYCSKNPDVLFKRANDCNHPAKIMLNSNVRAINMGLMCDLTGQIAVSGMGHRQISGPGGQLDFAIGAHFSPGGKSICCISAGRMKDGKFLSSILPELPAGTVVDVPRSYADYIVTEYGIASMQNKSRQQRAKELIAIAHPDVRDELREAALRNFWPDGVTDWDQW